MHVRNGTIQCGVLVLDHFAPYVSYTDKHACIAVYKFGIDVYIPL